MNRFATLVLALALTSSVYAATFTVDSTGDASDASAGNGTCAISGGGCTLRAAIQEANALAGADTINFGIGSGNQTIAPATALPAITSNITFDGTTQLGTGSGPWILIDGQGALAVGLDLSSSNLTVTIQGLAIGRFTEAGIKIQQSGAVITIKKCFIGVGLDGVTDLGNGDGILARVPTSGGGTLIVGDASGGGNVISGNNDAGIDVVDTSSGVGAKIGTFTIQGNIIGLGSDGMTSVSNAGAGIHVDGQFGTVTVGGSVAARNIISGNGGGGFITQAFFQADTIKFQYNYVGVAADGITARGNSSNGASLVARAFTIEQNVFAANGANGLYLLTSNLSSTVTGNRIGVAIDGSALGNATNGIALNGTSNLVIGGAGSNANIIANNGGIGIVTTTSANATIDENSIYSNAGLGIDLEGNGVTANDSLDSDSGSNGLQNFPVLSTAVRSGGVTFVNGALSSAASSTYTLRFFSSTAPDGTGYGEAETYLGAATVTTNVAGNASFTFMCTAPAGSYVTATASNASGYTSELSNALVVSGSPEFEMNEASKTVAESVGTFALTVNRLNGSAGTASVDWATVAGSASTSDFTPASGTLTFASGETSKTFNITIANDALDEALESFDVELSNPSSGTDLASTYTTTVFITDDDATPALSIANASNSEANASVSFTVTLSAPSGRSVTVDYLTSNGSAAAGSDYAAVTGTLTFAAGETSKTIAVPIAGDSAIELDEDFTVTLSNATNATIVTPTATGTITNDDGAPSITIDDVGLVEGDSATFTVTLSGPSASTVTVNWSTSDGTASAGADYVADSNTLTFAPGVVTQTIVVATNEDATVENNETFFVDLAGPSNATLGDAQGGGTIADDDGTPSISINDTATLEGVATSFTVTLAPASALPVSVSYATSDITASGSDYGAASGVLNFAAGETSKTIPVSVLNDAVAETTEQFQLTLSSPSGATLADGTGFGTIIDDDGAPRITIGNASDVESAGLLTFTVDLSHASASTVTVDWTTAGTGDYTPAGGTLSFAPGELSKTFDVLISDDAIVEPDQTFRIELSNATNATIVDSEGAATIVDDDGIVEVLIGDQSGAESAGTFAFDVTLTKASSQTVTVPWATADSTASAGSDYTAASGTLSFAPGETSKTISIAITSDLEDEPAETFLVNLLGATNATLTDAQAIGTIADDDVPLIVSVAPSSVTEGDSGSAPMTFDVTLNVATSVTVNVPYSTADVSAVAGADYAATSGTLTFAPGETLKTVAVPVLGDFLVEGSETFTLTAGAASATGTIIDNDSNAIVSIAPASITEGDAGTQSMTFTVSLNAANNATIYVPYSTSDGSAVAGADYAATSGTLTFAPGETSHTIAVSILGDFLVEGSETFTMTAGAASATGTIVDNDSNAIVSIAPASITEGDAGTQSMMFTVSLNAANNATIYVPYSTSDGSAVAGADYAATSGTLTFAPGETSHTIAVSILGDFVVEGDETFTLTAGAASATGTIVDNDSNAIVSIAPASIAEGDAGTQSMTFTVSLNAANNATIYVPYSTSDVSATAGADYAATSGTLTFAPGETSHTIAVSILGDFLVEGDETFTLSAGAASATGTIIDNDTSAVVSVGDESITEGDGGTKSMTFEVTLDAPNNATIYVAYATHDVTAKAGADYAAASGTLTFDPGVTAQTLTIPILGDTLDENDETFTLTAGAATATGTIVDNDRRPPTLHADAVRVIEGNVATITLTLTSRAPSGGSVRWMTRGDATDFVEAAGRVTFGTSTSATIEVQTVDDTLDENDETFFVELFDAGGLTLGEERVAVTIEDNDGTPARRAIVLAVGSLHGNAGSHFGTAVQMVNLGDTPAAGSLLIHPAGTTDSSHDATIPYALAPRELRAFDDLPGEHGIEGLATLDVIASEGELPHLTVRIYDDGSGRGTTGFTLPVVTPADALTAGESAVLVAPENPVAMRFNVGVRALDDGASMTIDVRDRTGALRRSTSREYAPNWFSQPSANEFAGVALNAGDYLVITITRGSAILYGATIDNLTNDPSVELAAAERR